jgi:hypothetical protein
MHTRRVLSLYRAARCLVGVGARSGASHESLQQIGVCPTSPCKSPPTYLSYPPADLHGGGRAAERDPAEGAFYD